MKVNNLRNATWYSNAKRNLKLRSSQHGRPWGLNHLVVMGWIPLTCYLLSFMAPPIGIGLLRVAYLATTVLFLIAAACSKRTRLRIVIPVVIAVLMQAWSVVTSANAALFLGRPMALGRPELYIIESLFPFFVAAQLVAIDERQRSKILNAIISMGVVSSVVGFLQFIRIPPAMALSRIYSVKAIDFWDGKPGVRAIGLTTHPNQLCFIATICFAAIAMQCFWRRLKLNDILMILLFTAASVVTQNRTGLAIIVVLWVVFYVKIWVSDRETARKLSVIVFGFGAVALVVAGSKMAYLTQSTSVTNDPSFAFRQQLWQRQMDPIFPRLQFTGVGPNAMILGTGPEDKWVPVGSVMENAFRLHLASYGIPGLVLYVALLLSAVIGAVSIAFSRDVSPDRRKAAMMGLAVAVSLVILSTASNTVDGYFVPQLSWIVCGISVSQAIGIRRPRSSNLGMPRITN